MMGQLLWGNGSAGIRLESVAYRALAGGYNISKATIQNRKKRLEKKSCYHTQVKNKHGKITAGRRTSIPTTSNVGRLCALTAPNGQSA
ncbi:hypothetical protein C7N83_02255 [Neisseria iguanae]|uniref:Uncharacterized protein n=1 Tax=Neisseria iguanae TaxID=90242 RepID=A0A2P7U279_9NEIS|nr:hypothetical protein C7N83_02255 [Neisseria iguanae]